MAILEICCGTLDSACAARQAGAQRIELCCALDEGGLTPSLGLMRAVAQWGDVTKHVLIRPRGGDFLYEESEVQIMLTDIAVAKAEGMDGVVVGALTSQGEVDRKVCERLLRAAEGMSVTFHRAFDLSASLPRALDVLVEMGFSRILSSGGAVTAEEGVGCLHSLVERAAGRIVVMPGCGVTVENVVQILRQTGAAEIHASARASRSSCMSFRRPAVAMGSRDRDEYERMETSSEKVAALLAKISEKVWLDQK